MNWRGRTAVSELRAKRGREKSRVLKRAVQASKPRKEMERKMGGQWGEGMEEGEDGKKVGMGHDLGG